MRTVVLKYTLTARWMLRTTGMLIAATFAVDGLTSMAHGQSSFTSNSATGAWNTARWNNSADASPYASTYTNNNNVHFTTGSYSFAGMGTGVNVGNVTVANNVAVSFSTNSSTFATGGNVTTFDIGSGGSFTFGSQSISSANGTGFIKSGEGLLNIGAGNTYNGGFTLNAGTVAASGNNSFGTGLLTINGGTIQSANSPVFSASNVVLNSNVRLTGTGAATFSNVNLGNATRTITIEIDNGNTRTLRNVTGSGGLVFENSNTVGSNAMLRTVELAGVNSYSGPTTLNRGRLLLSGGQAIHDSGAVIVANASQAVINLGNSETIGSLSGGGPTGGNFELSSNVLTISGSADASYGGVLSGSGGALIKSGASTQTLSGINTYTGSTTVTEGTLNVSGSIASSTQINVSSGANLISAGALNATTGTSTINGNTSGSGVITVSAGATLAGSGTVGNSLVVNGKLSPGNSIGTLNSGAVTWNGAANNAQAWEWELGAGDLADLLNITGNFTKGSGSVFAFNFSGVQEGNFQLVQWTGSTSFSLSDFTALGVDSNLYNSSFSIGANSLNFTVTAVPEPTSIIFGSIVTAAGGFGAWKRRRRSLKGEVGSLKEESLSA